MHRVLNWVYSNGGYKRLDTHENTGRHKRLGAYICRKLGRLNSLQIRKALGQLGAVD